MQAISKSIGSTVTQTLATISRSRNNGEQLFIPVRHLAKLYIKIHKNSISLALAGMLLLTTKVGMGFLQGYNYTIG